MYNIPHPVSRNVYLFAVHAYSFQSLIIPVYMLSLVGTAFWRPPRVTLYGTEEKAGIKTENGRGYCGRQLSKRKRGNQCNPLRYRKDHKT
ncbi:hypothetical protein BD311DRAFT_73120 [Dichomitus squalens]|uniref:Uncharacterized protein n=1 Tax=Dichomitus squalens TaxID=114155 RepID=A0A4Q9MCI7_9APHY|nr:hypothetical protein BD311DRAFT_73120 [Dichomitus squalens]